MLDTVKQRCNIRTANICEATVRIRNMANKKQQIGIRLTDEDKELLETLAEEKDVPASQIARQAIREKLAEIRAARERETAEVPA